MATSNDPEEVDDQNAAVANYTVREMSSDSPEIRELLNTLLTDALIQQQPTPTLMTPRAPIPGTVDSDTLELMLEEANQTFVPTRTFKDIRRSLEKNCHVSICGASGEGKTTMALMLGLKYIAQGYNLVFVNRLDMFDLGSCISSGQKICLIFDDVFGSVGQITDFTNIQTLCKVLKLHIDNNLMLKQNDRLKRRENGQTLVTNMQEREQVGGMDKDTSDKNKHQSSTKLLRVIFTAKTYNFQEGISKMQYQRLSIFNKKTVFDLTLDPERSYSHQEKRTMFQKHRDSHPNIKIKDNEVQDIHQVHQESIPFGFPLLCRLFFEFPTFTEKAVDFFKRPLYYLRIELNDILSRRNDQAAALILVLLCEENIKLPELESPNINKKVDEMFMYVTSFASSASRSGTAAAARIFRGTFLSKGGNLRFAHSSIYEACACAMYKFNPTFVLKYCSLDFLYERLKPGHVDESVVTENLHYLFVSEEYFPLVVARLISSMTQGIFSKTVAHPKYRDDCFVEKFLEELGKSALENMAWIQYKEKGRGFLYWVVRSKSKKLVQNIEKVLLINFSPEDIKEALKAAVECDSLTILKYLVGRLEQDPDETYMNELLHVSAESCSKEMVIYLLTIGAKISGIDTRNRNLLHLLCIHDRSTLLKFITSQAGFTSDDLQKAMNALDRDKRTPIMLAALHGTWDCFNQMQYEEIDDLSDCNGDHLINLACEGGNINIFQRVLTSENMNTRGHVGSTPIMTAAYKAQSEIFHLLFSKSADRDLVDNDGSGLLHCACAGGNEQIVECLVPTVNLNTRNYAGLTPIMRAANKAHTEVFDLLLSKNADRDLADGDGDTLLHHASLGGSRHIVERLITPENINTRGSNGWTPIMCAANGANTEVFDLLLSKNADRDLADGDGDTLLHHASVGGSRHIVERLITPENINTRGSNGWTPIMCAANHAHTEVFDLLSSKNADRDLADGDGDTLLHHASLGGSRHIVARLITPENINTRDSNGRTPIMCAANNAHTEVFDLLLSKNTDRDLADGNGNTLLHHASLGGSRHIVERLITPENINTGGSNGLTPIMWAANQAHTEVFDLLLSKNADRDLADGNGNNLLHHASLGGSRHIVERLITPENINTRGSNGRTHIMFAANKVHTEVFDLLLSKNADRDLADGDGNTLLHHASLGGSRHIVERLITPDNINTGGRYRLTPIMCAAIKAHTEVFDFLLSKNADTTACDSFRGTLLHHACSGGSTHIVECVLTPENVNNRTLFGVTPLEAAAVGGKSEVFDFLLSNNADTNTAASLGNTLLHSACAGGNKQIVERLLTPANINSRDFLGKTPLMIAASSSKLEVIDLLLSQNADTTLVDYSGDTLLHHSCEGGNKQIVERLQTPENIDIRNGLGKTPIMISASSRKIEVIDLLLSKNVDTSLLDNDGNSLLHIACARDNKSIVDRLLTSDNINRRGQFGRTPLMVATVNTNKAVFDLLLSFNAYTTLVDDNGDTLMHLACLGGSKHIVERLLTSDNINLRNHFGMTPIMIAALNGKKDVFDILWSKGANIDRVDDFGSKLQDHACIGGNKHIIERLVTSDNINRLDQIGRTPIMFAAKQGNADLFDLLLSRNADTTLVDDTEDTLLHYACIGGSKHIVELLLTSDNINTKGKLGRTPIMTAAVSGNLEVYNLLLLRNADTSLVDDTGATLNTCLKVGSSLLSIL